jgi:hypothetical protein
MHFVAWEGVFFLTRSDTLKWSEWPRDLTRFAHTFGMGRSWASADCVDRVVGACSYQSVGTFKEGLGRDQSQGRRDLNP